MRKITFLLVLSTIFLSLNIVTFKDEQKKYSRVRQAYKDKVEKVNTQLKNKSIKIDTFNVSYNPSLSIEEIVSSVSEIGDMKFHRFVVPRWLVIFL